MREREIDRERERERERESEDSAAKYQNQKERIVQYCCNVPIRIFVNPDLYLSSDSIIPTKLSSDSNFYMLQIEK